MSDTAAITASLQVLIYKESESGLYVSFCPALDLYSQGETRQEARANIIEATELFIECCIEDQTLQQVLADCGFRTPSAKKRRAKKIKLPPEAKRSKPFQISIEVPLLYG